MYSVAGRPSATCVSLISNARPGLARPAATRRASANRVARFVGWIASSRRSSSRRLSVNDLLDAGRVGKADDHRHVARGHLVDQLADARLASASRVGLTSVALMLAELSTRKMNRSPVNLLPRQPGRSSASMANGDQQQLQQQQQALPQPLPDAVDVQVFDRLVPQIRAGHLQRLALELEK